MGLASSYYKGIIFEIVAMLYLLIKGYKIIKTNYKTKLGEIDIIAKKNNVVVAVEVKKRTTIDLALEAISEKQKNRISSAFLYFLKVNPAYCNHNYRFDAILIAGIKPIHIKNAWLFKNKREY